MGRRDKSYHKDLKTQLYDKLTAMLKAGEGVSKKEAIATGTDGDKIFSYGAYESYHKHCKYFVSYVMQKHPECTTLKAARKYVVEWLQTRADRVKKEGDKEERKDELSAWTVTLERQALNKLYGIKPDDPDYFATPQRHRENIKRSRADAVRDRHFSVRNNDEFIKFCRGTGCRRNIMEKLRGRDLVTADRMKELVAELEAKAKLTKDEKIRLETLRDALEVFPDQDYFIYHRGDKGGRHRYAPIIGKNKDQIVERIRDTAPNDKVWLNVPKNADVHGYRGDYATAIYKLYALPIEKIPYDKVKKGTGIRYQSGVYVCRKDEKGKKLDRDAMLKASKALGHNRLEIVANNYIRGL